MLGKRAVDAELRKSLGQTIETIKPVLSAGGDTADREFMACCWCLWKANGAELVEPFVEATFNILPDKSRSVLFQRMLTIVYVAQDIKSESINSGDDKPSVGKEGNGKLSNRKSSSKKRNDKPSDRRKRKA